MRLRSQLPGRAPASRHWLWPAPLSVLEAEGDGPRVCRALSAGRALPVLPRREGAAVPPHLLQDRDLPGLAALKLPSGQALRLLAQEVSAAFAAFISGRVQLQVAHPRDTLGGGAAARLPLTAFQAAEFATGGSFAVRSAGFDEWGRRSLRAWRPRHSLPSLWSGRDVRCAVPAAAQRLGPHVLQLRWPWNTNDADHCGRLRRGGLRGFLLGQRRQGALGCSAGRRGQPRRGAGLGPGVAALRWQPDGHAVAAGRHDEHGVPGLRIGAEQLPDAAPDDVLLPDAAERGHAAADPGRSGDG
mmetsp:Transcript_49536/g.105982  ORF Transcript_49536/g.105982 Transcript_49536/m.105982 type:complete len:300 (-) Transcript_49536:521-1420(-)